MGRSITIPTGFYFPLRPKYAMDLLLSYGRVMSGLQALTLN